MSKILDYVGQPDARTCQSACIAMMIGDRDVYKIRSELENLGEPGDPAVMGRYLRPRVKSYQFIVNASLDDMFAHLEQGAKLITHGYFSRSGHVISVVNSNEKGFVVDDPYGQFFADIWGYTEDVDGDDLIYSRRLIYSACVAGNSYQDARFIYDSQQVMPGFKNAWLHIVNN